MKRIFFSLIVLLSGVLVGFGQTFSKKGADLNFFNKIPKEKVFVHYNSVVLLSGETLYYKVYCLNANKKTRSGISKIAYLELVAPNGKSIFRHKIKMESGEGQGDFFVPADVASGNYKLVGYTQWMRNEGVSSFFKGNLAIINPYEKGSKISIKTDNRPTQNDVIDTLKVNSTGKNEPSNHHITLSMHSNSYNKREKVSVKIMTSNDSQDYGKYSLSVRKMNEFDLPLIKTSISFDADFDSRPKTAYVYLPELRGQLISGRVMATETDLPLSNSLVAISIPGRTYTLDVVTTDNKGRFFFNLSSNLEGEKAVIQVLEKREDVEIETDTYFSADYSSLEFPPLKLSPRMGERIEKRSIHNQIENAYAEIKQDTLVSELPAYPFFYESNVERYDLDDYTRFPSIRETFIEIVQFASVKNINGKPTFLVTPNNSQLNSFSPPLLIVDGILVQDPNDIIEYGAKNIKRILVFREKYYYGPKAYQGALVFETLKGDYYQRMDKEDNYVKQLFKAQPRKKYYRQEYDTADGKENDHIPDYRYQLLWQPNFILDQQEKTIEFFTSDVTGNFEIRLEGFTDSGVPVSLQKVLTVDQNTN